MDYSLNGVIMTSTILFLFLMSSSSVSGKMVDLTHKLNNRSMHWPLFRDFELKSVFKGKYEQAEGIWVEANDIALSEHTGTHVDAPVHWCRLAYGATGMHIDDVKLENLMGPAVVIDITEGAVTDRDYTLTVGDIQRFEEKHGRIPDKAIVFIDTNGAKDYGNPSAYLGSATPDDHTTLHFPGFSGKSAQWLMDNRDIKGIGSDRMSFDVGSPDPLDNAHVTLLSTGRFGIENVNNIDKIPRLGATVFIMPLPIENGSGSPARIVAFWDTDIPQMASSSVPRASLLMQGALLMSIMIWVH